MPYRRPDGTVHVVAVAASGRMVAEAFVQPAGADLASRQLWSFLNERDPTLQLIA